MQGIRDAWIYGSWAERYHGNLGPPPRDLDVMIVGDRLDLLEIVAATDRLSDRTGPTVNAQTVTPNNWDHPQPDTFIARLRRGALVQVPISNTTADAPSTRSPTIETLGNVYG